MFCIRIILGKSTSFLHLSKGENAYGEADIKELCRSYEALENEYNDFFPIAEVTGIRPAGYIINFPLFIQAEKDAHVLLTTRAVSDRSDDCYEICKRSMKQFEIFDRI